MIARESPLKGDKKGSAETVAIRELPGLSTVDLRVAMGTPAQHAVAEALCLELPAKPGQSKSNQSKAHALCLGPDWWLIVGMPETLQALTSLRDEHHLSATDVSGQRTVIELEGPDAREVLASLWEQDLRDKNFPVGSVSQGLMVKAPVIVWRVAADRYRIMVRSSFAFHLWQALTDAANVPV